MKTNKKTGPARLWYAFKYSMAGLKASIRYETAFRQELVLFFLLLPVIILLPISITYKLILLIVNSLVLVAELLNSAIEAVVDMTSPNYHDLAKRAKDTASAAVFITLLLAAITWTTACFVAFK